MTRRAGRSDRVPDDLTGWAVTPPPDISDGIAWAMYQDAMLDAGCPADAIMTYSEWRDTRGSHD
jgi:hypothetical protein